MKISRKKIMDLPAVYVAASLSLKGKQYFAVASENKDEHKYIIDAETLAYHELWNGDTGVMSIVQIPGREQLLCITKFYPVFQSKEAVVNLLKPNNEYFMDEWSKEEVLSLPFVHRIGVVKNKFGLFFLGCTLCKDKAFQGDWSQPGSLWVAPIPVDENNQWNAIQVFSGLTKNHGFLIDNDNQVYIGSQNGLMLFDFSDYQQGRTIMPTLISTTPTSDISVFDDGEMGKLIGTIEPFHGNTLALYNWNQSGLSKLSEYPIDFGHVVWVGKIFGTNAILAGSRGGDKALKIYFLDKRESIVLDTGVGPTQITVCHRNNEVRILSANHGAGNVSLYSLIQE